MVDNPPRPKMTLATKAVLSALVSAPSVEHYGLDLARITGLRSGSLYPILARLESVGWVSSRWENVDASAVGRPRRRYYRLTASGVIAGEQIVTAMQGSLLARGLA